MANGRRLLGTMLAAITFLAPALADETKSDMEAVRAALRANKKALIATNLTLTDEEAKRFWPIYEEYEADMKGVQERASNVITDYAAMRDALTDEQAANLTAAYLLADEDRATFRRVYLRDFAKVLPGKTLARFYLIENKFDAEVRYQIAASLPLIKQ